MKTSENRKYIKIRGANEHNLKNIDVDIPRDEFVVLTGLSVPVNHLLRLTRFMRRDRDGIWSHCPPMQDSF